MQDEDVRDWLQDRLRRVDVSRPLGQHTCPRYTKTKGCNPESYDHTPLFGGYEPVKCALDSQELTKGTKVECRVFEQVSTFDHSTQMYVMAIDTGPVFHVFGTVCFQDVKYLKHPLFVAEDELATWYSTTFGINTDKIISQGGMDCCTFKSRPTIQPKVPEKATFAICCGSEVFFDEFGDENPLRNKFFALIWMENPKRRSFLSQKQKRYTDIVVEFGNESAYSCKREECIFQRQKACLDSIEEVD